MRGAIKNPDTNSVAWKQMAAWGVQQCLSIVRYADTSFCKHMQGHICNFKINCKLYWRANIKFCMKLGKTGAKTFQMSQHA